MSPSRPRSFRRILLLRILLLSFPILLIGQYATLRKARSSLLETARQNLESSAIRKAESFELSLKALESHLQTLTQTSTLQTGSIPEIDAALANFNETFPFSVTCLQLTDAQTQTLALDTCPTALPEPADPLPWLTQSGPADSFATDFYLIAAGQSADMFPRATSSDRPEDDHPNQAYLDVIVATPVYGIDGQLRYTLAVHAMIDQLQNTDPRSLVGDTVVIDDQLRILVHPDPAQVGKTVDQVNSADRLQSLVGNVWAGNSGTLHLFGLMSNKTEWIAGYTGLQVTIAPNETRQWTVLAVTPLDHALQALWDIRVLLIALTLGLLAANALLALYIARSLSLPIEHLRQYAEQIQDLSHFQAAPQDFHIWELNRLARVLNCMIKRLDDRATELRHAWQDAQLANQLKNEFLANTSHELRTPLNGIIGFVRLVKDGLCDDHDEELEFLDRADQAAIHLLNIINDILDIAKIESGTLAVELQVVNLSQVMAEVMDLQMVQIQEKGLMLHRPDISTPIWVEADRAKLKQVLINITSNAIKFTEEGSIALSVIPQAASPEPCLPPSEEALAASAPEADAPQSSPTASSQTASGQTASAQTASAQTVPEPALAPQVVIEIRDTGIGIEPKQQHKLFRPFVMVDGSTTRRFEGTGLGLAISKNLITLMAGTITLTSEGIGQGTTVTLTLPQLIKVPEEADVDAVSPRKLEADAAATPQLAKPHALSASPSGINVPSMEQATDVTPDLSGHSSHDLS